MIPGMPLIRDVQIQLLGVHFVIDYATILERLEPSCVKHEPPRWSVFGHLGMGVEQTLMRASEAGMAGRLECIDLRNDLLFRWSGLSCELPTCGSIADSWTPIDSA